jgi:linoleoyl-CoA desaturase
MALVGVAIQHDANHGAMSSNKHVCTVFGATLDYLAGASSYMWRQQHDYGHHSYTNIHDKDPDIRVTDSDIRRVTKWQPWHSWHLHQHIYLPILYSLLALKSIFVDDFAALYIFTPPPPFPLFFAESFCKQLLSSRLTPQSQLQTSYRKRHI